MTVGHADPEIPDAPASGRIIPIPAKSGWDVGNPESGIPTKPGFKSGKIPIFFAAARAVIKKTCQRQARLVRFLIGVPGWEKRLIVH